MKLSGKHKELRYFFLLGIVIIVHQIAHISHRLVISTASWIFSPALQNCCTLLNKVFSRNYDIISYIKQNSGFKMSSRHFL